MEELLILISAGLLTFLLAAVKSMQLAPSSESEFELQRRAAAHDSHAQHELNRRMALPLLAAVQRFKIALLVALLAGLLVATHPAWGGMVLLFFFLLIAECVAVRGWLAAVVWNVQRKVEPKVVSGAWRVRFLLNLWAPPSHAGLQNGSMVASRAELQQMISQDKTVLTPAEKAGLLGALNFGHTTVRQGMVPADQITTVELGETVGPLLLDRLHKAGHNIFPVVKKDINHIKGLLYMADLVPLDPDLKAVQDALRPTVHYLPAKAHLSTVLSASLQTGRQLFIVVNEAGETQGLITLSDALNHLLGQPLGKDAPVATKAK